MKRISLLILLSLSLFFSLMGCGSDAQSNSDLRDYKNDYVAAIVNDKEITIGDLRFLYPDEMVLEGIEGFVKLELMIQEANKMDKSVSKDMELQKETLKSSISSEDDTTMSEFIESQAQKLGMSTDEYSEKYVKIRSEIDAYMNLYLQETFGNPNQNDENEIMKYDEKVNEHLNELVKDNEHNIEILIK